MVRGLLRQLSSRRNLLGEGSGNDKVESTSNSTNSTRGGDLASGPIHQSKKRNGSTSSKSKKNKTKDTAEADVVVTPTRRPPQRRHSAEIVRNSTNSAAKRLQRRHSQRSLLGGSRADLSGELKERPARPKRSQSITSSPQQRGPKNRQDAERHDAAISRLSKSSSHDEDELENNSHASLHSPSNNTATDAATASSRIYSESSFKNSSGDQNGSGPQRRSSTSSTSNNKKKKSRRRSKLERRKSMDAKSETTTSKATRRLSAPRLKRTNSSKELQEDQPFHIQQSPQARPPAGNSQHHPTTTTTPAVTTTHGHTESTLSLPTLAGDGDQQEIYVSMTDLSRDMSDLTFRESDVFSSFTTSSSSGRHKPHHMTFRGSGSISQTSQFSSSSTLEKVRTLYHYDMDFSESTQGGGEDGIIQEEAPAQILPSLVDHGTENDEDNNAPKLKNLYDDDDDTECDDVDHKSNNTSDQSTSGSQQSSSKLSSSSVASHPQQSQQHRNAKHLHHHHHHHHGILSPHHHGISPNKKRSKLQPPPPPHHLLTPVLESQEIPKTFGKGAQRKCMNKVGDSSTPDKNGVSNRALHKKSNNDSTITAANSNSDDDDNETNNDSESFRVADPVIPLRRASDSFDDETTIPDDDPTILHDDATDESTSAELHLSPMLPLKSSIHSSALTIRNLYADDDEDDEDDEDYIDDAEDEVSANTKKGGEKTGSFVAI